MTALRLDLEWRTTLLTVILFPALIALGFWQLDRAAEKVAIAERNAQRQAAPPASIDDLLQMDTSDFAYLPAKVSGHYLEDFVILLDNQIRDGRYGHDVFGLFLDEPSGQIVLLNRGWVQADASRRSLPSIDTPTGRHTLYGQIYVPPGEPYLLAEDNFAALAFPLLVQSATADGLRAALEKRFNSPVFSAEFRLAADQETGFRRDWPLINVSPQKHRAYAVQWFTMAAALLLFFALRSSNVLAVLRGKRAPAGSPADEP